MNKVLTDIYGSIYITDKAVRGLQQELRRQKTATGFLAVGLICAVLYIWIDISDEDKQNKRIEELEQQVQRMSVGA